MRENYNEGKGEVAIPVREQDEDVDQWKVCEQSPGSSEEPEAAVARVDGVSRLWRKGETEEELEGHGPRRRRSGDKHGSAHLPSRCSETPTIQSFLPLNDDSSRNLARTWFLCICRRTSPRPPASSPVTVPSESFLISLCYEWAFPFLGLLLPSESKQPHTARRRSKQQEEKRRLHSLASRRI